LLSETYFLSASFDMLPPVAEDMIFRNRRAVS
jgi:hypothetical protein